MGKAGEKHDDGKDPWHLLPWSATRAVVKVLGFGAKKYAPHGWREVPDPGQRYFSAAIRHITAWNEGERADPESGLHHLAHAACCILFLLSLDDG